MKYNSHVSNVITCIYKIATESYDSHTDKDSKVLMSLLVECYNSLDCELSELNMGFNYSVIVDGNPHERLYTQILKTETHISVFFNPIHVFSAWFWIPPEKIINQDSSPLIQFCQLMQYSKIYSFHLLGNEKDRLKKISETITSMMAIVQGMTLKKNEILNELRKIPK